MKINCEYLISRFDVNWKRYVYKEQSLKVIIEEIRGMEDTKVERICKDAFDLFLSTKLEKVTKRVTLEEVISLISEKVIEYEDTTKIVREMREKKYD